MPPLRFGRVDSPLGPMWVAETDSGVAACSLADTPAELVTVLRRRFPGLEPEPAEVAAGWVSRGLPPPLDLSGLPDFDARVYRLVQSVRPGETITYGEVAALIGSPGAARAVGGAMARCPLFPAVPCHRVVRASDGWSGWGGDPALKRRLLAEERRRASRAASAADGPNSRQA